MSTHWAKALDVANLVLPTAVGAATTAAEMRFARQEAKTQRKWLATMSNTEMQRRVADLKAAGINPLVAAMGSGASTPTPGQANVSGAATRGVANALAVKQTLAQVRLINAQAQKESNTAALLATQNEEARGLLGMRAGETRVRVEGMQISNRQAREMLPSLVAEAKERVKATAAGARSEIGRAHV